MHAGEFESRVSVTKRTRHRYLWTRVVTAKLQAASASGFGHRTKDFAAAVAHGSEQGMEKGRGGLGLYRRAAAAYKEGEQGGFGAFHTWAPVAFQSGLRH